MAILNDSIVRGGLRVTDDANVGGNVQAATFNGLPLSGSVGANTIPIRDSNGYVYFNYINTNAGVDNTATSSSYFLYANSDGWIRKANAATIKSALSIVADTNQTIKAKNNGSGTAITFGADDAIELIQGSNITISVDSTNKTITIAGTANTATAADNILDGSNSGTQITYAPYSSQQSRLSFDTSSTNPTRTDRLNLNGYLYATKLYSGGNEVLTSYSETDTLATVTGRGATTSTQVTMTGGLIVTGANLKLDKISAPTSSGGTTYGNGSNGQVLKSNGTTVYWASDSNSNQTVKGNGTAFGASDAVDILGTSPISVTANTTNKTITIAVADATTSAKGVIALTDANLNTMINQLSTGSSTPTDNDYYVSQYVGGGTTTTTYHRRPMSALWTYVKGKADSVYATIGHSHTLSIAADSGTSALSLALGSKYKLTAGGSTFIFTMPSTPNALAAVATIGGSNTATYPYHRIMRLAATHGYADTEGTFYLTANYNGGPYYIFRVEQRANADNAAPSDSVIRILLTNADPANLKLGQYNYTENNVRYVQTDVFVKVGTWPRMTLYKFGQNTAGTFTFYNSTEATDAASHTEAYKGLDGSSADYASYACIGANAYSRTADGAVAVSTGYASSGHSHTITANATDGIWDITGTNGTNAVTYAVDAYSAKGTSARFYTAATNPTLTTRLNYDGYLYATKLYSGGTEVLTGHQSIKTLDTTATTAQSTSSSETITGSGTIKLHKVAKTGTYSDLIGKPTIPATNVIPTTTTANKVLLSTSVGGTAAWSAWSTAGFLETNSSGVVSVSSNIQKGTTSADTNIYISGLVLGNPSDVGKSYIQNEIPSGQLPKNQTFYLPFMASGDGGVLATQYWVGQQGYTTNTGTVIGSGLTAEYFVVGNGTVNVKISSMRPSTSSTTWSTSSDVYVPTMKAISNYVTGLGYTTNTGTVTSVRVQAGTGLSSSTSTAQSSTLDTTISIASGYKLPTTTEWNNKGKIYRHNLTVEEYNGDWVYCFSFITSNGTQVTTMTGLANLIANGQTVTSTVRYKYGVGGYAYDGGNDMQYPLFGVGVYKVGKLTTIAFLYCGDDFSPQNTNEYGVTDFSAPLVISEDDVETV